MNLQILNTAPRAQLASILLACCHVDSWVDAVIADRPYTSLIELCSRGGDHFDDLSDADIDRAVAAHPRIGARVTGNGREAAWSRQEQGTLDDIERAQLAELNQTYEERFNRVFLIHAQGRTAAEMITEIRSRLGNDPDTENRLIREQLRRIVLARLAKAVALAESGEPFDVRETGICTDRGTA